MPEEEEEEVESLLVSLDEVEDVEVEDEEDASGAAVKLQTTTLAFLPSNFRICVNLLAFLFAERTVLCPLWRRRLRVLHM